MHALPIAYNQSMRETVLGMLAIRAGKQASQNDFHRREDSRGETVTDVRAKGLGKDTRSCHTDALLNIHVRRFACEATCSGVHLAKKLATSCLTPPPLACCSWKAQGTLGHFGRILE